MNSFLFLNESGNVNTRKIVKHMTRIYEKAISIYVFNGLAYISLSLCTKIYS